MTSKNGEQNYEWSFPGQSVFDKKETMFIDAQQLFYIANPCLTHSH